MLRKILRGFLIGSLIAIGSLTIVGESRAFFGLFQRHQNATAAMYGGTVCNPCGQQLVANYVPQTCYRVQYCAVPQVTYRPVSSCDPCSGCQTTCMRPVTTYVQQARYVPYTTYRVVYSAAQPACPTATTSYYVAPAAYAAPAGCATGGCGSTVNYAAPAAATVAPSLSGAVVPQASSGCSSCGASGAATAYYAPSAAAAGTAPTYNYSAPSTPTPAYRLPSNSPTTPSYSYYGAPSYSTTSPGATASPTIASPTIVTPTPPASGAAGVSPNMPTPAPPLGSTTAGGTTASSENATSSTYERKADAGSTDAMKPIPDTESTTPPPSQGPRLDRPTSVPRLYDPQDKTAMAWPVEQAWSYSPVSAASWQPVNSGAVAAQERPPIVQAAVLETPTFALPAAATPGPIVSPRPTVDGDGWQASQR